jgi:hypothetical protein
MLVKIILGILLAYIVGCIVEEIENYKSDNKKL